MLPALAGNLFDEQGNTIVIAEKSGSCCIITGEECRK